jgi:sugar porter (SP) family MFS transporter
MHRVILRRRHAAFYYASIVSLGGFLFGFDASVISGAVSFIVPQFGLNDWQLGLVVAAPTLGGIIAAMSGGPLADLAGRKRLLLALALLYTISALASAFAPGYAVLVIARFIGGLAFASLSVAPMYIGEIAPREKRGMLISVNQLNIMVGFSVAYFANYFVLQASQSELPWAQALGLDRNAWRWMLGIEAIPAVAWFLLLFRVPESPRWLVMRRRCEDARGVLRRLKPPELVARDLVEIEESLLDAQERFLPRLKEVFLPAMRLPLIIGLVVAIAQQVTGINAVYFYAPTIFEQSGVGTNAAFAQATLIGIINVVFTVVAMLLIDRLGRRPLLLIGLAGVVLSMALTGYGFRQASYELSDAAVAQLSVAIDRDALRPLINVPFDDDLAFKRALREAAGEQAVREHGAELIQAAIDVDPVIVLIGILGFVASFAVSLGPVMWCLLAEIFPNRARGPAMAFVGLFNSMASFAVQLVFPWELSNLGNASIFFIYAAFGVAALLLVAWLLPETKGKSLEELETMLGARV